MHILTTKRKKKGKVYISHFLAQSYWNKEKKQPRNRLIAKLTGLPDEIIQTIREHLKAKGGPLVASEKLEANSSRDHGLVGAYWGLGDSLGLWKLLNKYLGQQTERVMGDGDQSAGRPEGQV